MMVGVENGPLWRVCATQAITDVAMLDALAGWQFDGRQSPIPVVLILSDLIERCTFFNDLIDAVEFVIPLNTQTKTGHVLKRLSNPRKGTLLTFPFEYFDMVNQFGALILFITGQLITTPIFRHQMYMINFTMSG
nr:hypothetical protein [Marinobacter fonticola]